MPVIQRYTYVFFSPWKYITDNTLESLHKGELERPKIYAASSSPKVRKFILSELNLECDDYINLNNSHWIIFKPLLSMGFSVETITNNIQNKGIYRAAKYSLHTQTLERVIKLVNEALSFKFVVMRQKKVSFSLECLHKNVFLFF